MNQQILLPEGWPRPSGYSNGIAVRGTQIFVAGQIGWDANGKLVGPDFAAQAKQALLNIVAVLNAGGARPEHVVRLTWYVTNADQYRAASVALGAAYRDVMGQHFPVMSAVQVVALMEREAVVEIEATAVVPDDSSTSDVSRR